MRNHKIVIESIVANSIAQELGVQKGDKLISVNGRQIEDILEYKFLICEEKLIVEIEKPNNEIWELEIEKDCYEDLGFVFTGIIDKQKTCCNKCIFCFIDQLPKGMRKTLYFKDDDTRLSFLQGNFVTLTNLNNEDIDKIIRYRISPINISIHTTNKELRCKMLGNKKAGKLLEYLERLKEGNIEMKAQIVLCPDINDGEHFKKTIDDLYKLYPELSCVAVVPVGLTKWRQGLYPLKQYSNSEALNIIKLVEKMQDLYLEEIGRRFVFLSDEFYIIALKELPTYEEYEDFYQLENGVGIIRLFQKEIDKSLTGYIYKDSYSKNATIITGEYAKSYLQEAINKIIMRFKGIKVEVIGIKNEFFGTSVKVSGLITGKDIINQLKNKNISNSLLIPSNMLKKDENIFLDDLTLKDIEKALDVKVTVCSEYGDDLVNKLLGLC